MAIFYRDIVGELQYKKVVVESGSRRYVEIQLFFHKFRRFCRLPSLFLFRTFGQLTKANRAEIKKLRSYFYAPSHCAYAGAFICSLRADGHSEFQIKKYRHSPHIS